MSNLLSRPDKDTLLINASRKMVTDVLDAINTQARIHGKEFGSDLSIHFVACYFGAVAFNTLNYQPREKVTKEKMYDIVSTKYRELKIRMSEAVASGFTGAMRTHTGKQELEYYCVVKPVPPVANKKPC